MKPLITHPKIRILTERGGTAGKSLLASNKVCGDNHSAETGWLLK